jgi:hypothetical protein
MTIEIVDLAIKKWWDLSIFVWIARGYQQLFELRALFLFRGLIRTRRKNLALRAFRVKMLETGARNAKRLWVVGGGTCQEMW